MANSVKFALCLALAPTPAFAQTYPGATWTSKTPAEVGMDVTKLDAVRDYMGGRGFISRFGTQVYTWGSYTTRGDVASAAKPWYSTFLFKAVEEGRIASLDTRVNTVET